MSGFHLASIGFLGTSGCTALHPGFGLNRPALQLHPDDPSNYPCQWFGHSTETPCIVYVVSRPCWGKPLCENDCVVRHMDTCRDGKIFRKYEHQDTTITTGGESILYASPTFSSTTRHHSEEPNRLCLSMHGSPPGYSQRPTSLLNGSARATDQHIRVANEEENLPRLLNHAITDDLQDNALCCCVDGSQRCHATGIHQHPQHLTGSVHIKYIYNVLDYLTHTRATHMPTTGLHQVHLLLDLSSYARKASGAVVAK